VANPDLAGNLTTLKELIEWMKIGGGKGDLIGTL
jgi:hypothetical protein